MGQTRQAGRWLAMVLALMLLAAACGGGDEGGGEAGGGGAGGSEGGGGGGGGGGSVTFFSTQLAPVEEAEKVRNSILAGYEGEFEFIGADNYGAWVDRILAEAEANDVTLDLLGSLHGDFVSLGTEHLTDVSDLMEELSDREFTEDFVDLTTIGTDTSYYVPWMQATYIMVANRQALEYLPEGADVNSLTYEQYLEWGRRIYEETGRAMVGFPAGQDGLIHRFFQGYLLPSFTGGLVTTFTDSEPAWQWMSDIWEYTHPQSVGYGFMQDPLLSEEVWVAWDHVARLINALEQRPDDFVAFPAPTGPEGLAYMPVVAGLAIPQGAPNPDGARDMIRHLTEFETQVTTLREVAFFPVVSGELPEDISPGLRAEAEAVEAQSTASDALPSLLPVGLGDAGGDFDKIFVDTFTRIVLDGEEIGPVLEQQAETMSALMEQTGAPCWEPDPPSDGEPCQVN